MNIVGQHIGIEEFINRWAADPIVASQAYIHAVEQVVALQLHTDLLEEELKVALNGYFVKYINTIIPLPLCAAFDQGRVAYGVLLNSHAADVKLRNVIKVEHPF